MKWISLLVELALAISVFVAANTFIRETAIASTDVSQKQKIAISLFEVSDLPLKINSEVLVRTRKGHILRCSIANRSDEEITGVGFLVLVFDSSHKLKDTARWSERVELPAYSIKEYSFKAPTERMLAAEDQIAVVVEQVIGRESIWQVLKAEDALKAYATGGQHSAPDVRRLSNRWLWP
jgi:hypothetical protein